jgi:hypothetical protein
VKTIWNHEKSIHHGDTEGTEKTAENDEESLAEAAAGE